MRQTVYYQRGAEDPILENKVVLDIVRHYAPQAQEVSGIDESGGEARVYNVDHDIIVKVQRPNQLRNTTSLKKETYFLEQIARHTDVSVPRVLGYGTRGSIEYLCMTRMPGVAAESVKLTKREKHNLLITVGRELRKIHSLDQNSFLQSGLFPTDEHDDLVDRLRRRFRQALLKQESAIGPEKLALALQELETILKRIPVTDAYVALHVNPYIPHVFVDPTTHVYSGIIDFGDAYIGHPIFDMWYWRVASRRVLLGGYTAEKPVSSAFLATVDALDEISRLTKI